MTTNRYGDEILPNQVWSDNDPRSEGRTVRIDSTDNRYAYCEVLTAAGGTVPKVKRARILIDRLHPTRTGYRLIEDPAPEAES